MNWFLDQKISGLERDLYTKANSYDLDSANRKIREVEQDLARETANRQSLEHRFDQIVQRLEDLESERAARLEAIL